MGVRLWDAVGIPATQALAHGGLGLATGAGLSCKHMLPTPKPDRAGDTWEFETPPASALPVLPLCSLVLRSCLHHHSSGVALQATGLGASISLLAPSPACSGGIETPWSPFRQSAEPGWVTC